MNQLEWMQRQIDQLTKRVNDLSTLDKPNRLNAWQPIFQAASYVSATSILFTGADLTTYMTGYVKCRWYQSGWRYGYISASSLGSGNTTAVILGNAVLNAAITNFSISYGNPVDISEWFGFATTISSSVGTITSYTVSNAIFKIDSRILSVLLSFTITNNGTGSGSVRFTVPFTLTTQVLGYGRENALTGNMLQVRGTSSPVSIFTYNNNYPGGTNYVIEIFATAGV